MIRLELTLTDVDFDTLIELYLPQLAEKLRASGNPVGMLLSNGMSPAMAKTVLRTLSQEKKEQLCADLINGNSARIAELFESAAAQKGIRFHVAGASAKAE